MPLQRVVSWVSSFFRAPETADVEESRVSWAEPLSQQRIMGTDILEPRGRLFRMTNGILEEVRR